MRDFFVDNASCPPAEIHRVSPSNEPTPVASASSSVSPSPFAPPSRSSSHQTSEPRDAVIPTMDEHVVGNAREDDSQPRPRGPRERARAVTSNCALLAPARPGVSTPTPILCAYIRCMTESAPCRSSLFSQPRRTSKTPLFLLSPSESEPPPRRDKNWVADLLDVISVASSSNSPPPRKT